MAFVPVMVVTYSHWLITRSRQEIGHDGCLPCCDTMPSMDCLVVTAIARVDACKAVVPTGVLLPTDVFSSDAATKEHRILSMYLQNCTHCLQADKTDLSPPF